MRRRHLLALTCAAALATSGLGVTGIGAAGPAAADPATDRTTGPATGPAAAAGTPTPPDWLALEDGMAQPQFDLDEAVTETLWVQTQVDSDLDGTRDRVRVQVARPAETEGTGAIRVPVVFEHSPYRSNTGGGVNHEVDYSVMPQEGRQPRGRTALAVPDPVSKAAPGLPGSLDDYWVPRGFAVVLGESIGTGLSDGCPSVGDAKETLSTKAVIDWLGGRAAAYDSDGRAVRATWSTGDVGMTGVSYNGTLPNMVATTGVEGLRTIVPVSAIASWYDYYRANGLVRAPHSEVSGAGDNAYLGEDLDVLAEFVHGPSRVQQCRHVVEEMRARQDRVTGDYSAYWRQRDYLRRAGGVRASVFVVHGLEDYNVMPTAYSSWYDALGQAGVTRKIWLHNGGHGGPSRDSGYQEELNRWMTHFLFGVRNGITREPRADVQRPDGRYEQYADWPAPGSRAATLRLGARSVTEPGTLTTTAPRGPRPRQSFVDAGRERNTDASLIQAPDVADVNRLAYLSGPLRRDVHLSGTPSVSLRASVDNRYAANLTAVLVDYGPVGSDAEPVMVTRGWADVQNRTGAQRTRPIQQGQEYTFGFDLEPDDHVFARGHRIGLVVVSTDQQFTVRPDPGTRLTVDPARSSLELPVVGGVRSLRVG